MVYVTLQTFPKKKACDFCQTRTVNPITLGNIYKIGEIVVHYFCLLLASKGVQRGTDRQGLLGFLPKDIKSELKRGSQIKCIYCLRKGATVLCSKSKCKANFHLPCGLKNNSLHYFCNDFRSFCVKHRSKPKFTSQLKKENTICILCCNTVNPKDDVYDLIWPPCCKPSSLQHRKCLQQLAYSAGYYFKCPFCNNEKKFNKAMRECGIYIPEQEASWERDPLAYSDYRVDLKCYAGQSCKCPKGISYSRNNTKWDLESCSLCGGNATHKECIDTLERGDDCSMKWVCPDCRTGEDFFQETNSVMQTDSNVDLLDTSSTDTYFTASERFHSSVELEDYKVKVGNNALKDKGRYVLYPDEASTSASTKTGIVLFLNDTCLNLALKNVSNIVEMIVNNKRCLVSLNKVNIDTGNHQESGINKPVENVEIIKLNNNDNTADDGSSSSCSRSTTKEMTNEMDSTLNYTYEDNESGNSSLIEKTYLDVKSLETFKENTDQQSVNDEMHKKIEALNKNSISYTTEININLKLEIDEYLNENPVKDNSRKSLNSPNKRILKRKNEKVPLKVNKYKNTPFVKIAKKVYINELIVNNKYDLVLRNYRNCKYSFIKEIWCNGLKRSIVKHMNEFQQCTFKPNVIKDLELLPLYPMLENSEKIDNIKEKFRQKVSTFINGNNCMIFTDKSGIIYADLLKSLSPNHEQVQIFYGLDDKDNKLLDSANKLIMESLEKFKIVILKTTYLGNERENEFFTKLIEIVKNHNCIELVFCKVPRSKQMYNCFQNRMHALFNKKLSSCSENFNFQVWDLKNILDIYV